MALKVHLVRGFLLPRTNFYLSRCWDFWLSKLPLVFVLLRFHSHYASHESVINLFRQNKDKTCWRDGKTELFLKLYILLFIECDTVCLQFYVTHCYRGWQYQLCWIMRLIICTPEFPQATLWYFKVFLCYRAVGVFKQLDAWLEYLTYSRLYFHLFEELREHLISLVCHHCTIVLVPEAPYPSGKPTSHTLKTLKQSSCVFGPAFYYWTLTKICSDEISPSLKRDLWSC